MPSSSSSTPNAEFQTAGRDSSFENPIPLTSILGREAEIDLIVGLLDRGDHRIVNLLGPGGVGKTRLAQEVSRRIAPEFAHGVRFVSLASIRDPALVPKAVAQSIGIQETADRPATAMLQDLLANRHVLLVLDNLEQVIGTAAWLAQLLSHCSLLKVLATSRIALDVAGEQRVVVSPLPVGDRVDPSAPSSAAVELFTQRARAIDVGFHLNERNAHVVQAICNRLDGLPLAIELAAARVKILSPDAILARLTNRLVLLTGGRRDLPARLQTMWDAIEWSYALLPEADQDLFCRLSVFSGGFTLAAAEFVAAWPDLPRSDNMVVDTIGRLVDHSLLVTVPEAQETRYHMLETIRDFGLSEIDPGDGQSNAHERHAMYYRHLAEQSEKVLHGPDQASRLDLLEREHANIRAAMAWLETNQRLDDAIVPYAQIKPFLDLRGHAVEALQRLDAWLATPASSRRTWARGMALLAAGGFRQNLGDTAASSAMLGEAADILMDANDSWHAAMAQSILASTYALTGELERMATAVHAALDLARSASNHRAISTCLLFLSWQAERAADREGAARLEEESFRVAEDAGDYWVLAARIGRRARRALRDGDQALAERLASESKEMFERIGSIRDLAGAWYQLAWIARQRGDLERAENHVDTGLAFAVACGHARYEAHGHLMRGLFIAELGEIRRGQEAMREGVRLFHAGDLPVEFVDCLDAHAMLAATNGDGEQAARFLGIADVLIERLGIDRDNWDLEFAAHSLSPSLRADLGEPTFTRAYTEGVELTMEEAMTAIETYVPRGVATERAPAPEPVATRHNLSRRELEVLQLVAAGMTNRQIADAMFLSPRTIASHIASILAKLDLPSRTSAVAYAIRNHLA